MLTPAQLFDEAQAIVIAGHAAVTQDDRHAMAIALFFQGYSAGRACHVAFVELEDNDGALQMLARHRLAALRPATIRQEAMGSCAKDDDLS